MSKTYPFDLPYFSQEIREDVELWIFACGYAPYAFRGAPMSVLRDERIIAGLAENGYKITGTNPDDINIEDISDN